MVDEGATDEAEIDATNPSGFDRVGWVGLD